MKTLIYFLCLLALLSIGFGQEDTTVVVTSSTDSLLSDGMSNDTMDVDTLTADGMEADNMPAETLTESRIRLLGLMNEGTVYYWSNDQLSELGFRQDDQFQFIESGLIAARANDCIDIVCNLLATDVDLADYVIISAKDSSYASVYEISTRTTILEVDPDELKASFINYLASNALQELPLAAVPDTVVSEEPSFEPTNLAVPDPRELKEAMFLKLENRRIEKLFNNPANLARDFDSFTSWNFLPDLKFNIYNSLLTPGWYKKWWTTGGVWDQATKNEYLSTLENELLTINIFPEFNTLFGFRIATFGLNISSMHHIKTVIPGNLLGILQRDILFDEPIDNSGLEVEAIPVALKSSLSYGQKFALPFGDVKAGVNLNIYEANGYMRMVSEDLSVTMTQDSAVIYGSGDVWLSAGGQTGIMDEFDFDAVDISSLASDITFGVDLGFLMDLEDHIGQDVELQVGLLNIGAKYKWSNLTHETWELSQTVSLTDETEDTSDTTDIISNVVSDSEELSVKVPLVFQIGGIYQPLPNLLLSVGIEKAFTDKVIFKYSPNLEFSMKASYYPVTWLDVSYALQPRFGDPANIFGAGLHFGFLDIGGSMAIINGLNSNAKGMGFGFYTNMYF